MRRKFPFQAEACLLLMFTGMRIQECLKIKKSMITEDEEGDFIIVMPRFIMKGRANQKQEDEIYDVTPPVQKVLDSLKRQLKRKNLRRYRMVNWLFPSTRISLEKLGSPKEFPGYANSKACRTKTLDDCLNEVKRITGIQLSLKTLKKANIHYTNETLGGAHKGKLVSKHKTEHTNSRNYDKGSRREIKKLARRVAKVFDFKTKKFN